jgi:hypothetical protein
MSCIAMTMVSVLLELIFHSKMKIWRTNLIFKRMLPLKRNIILTYELESISFGWKPNILIWWIRCVSNCFRFFCWLFYFSSFHRFSCSEIGSSILEMISSVANLQNDCVILSLLLVGSWVLMFNFWNCYKQIPLISSNNGWIPNLLWWSNHLKHTSDISKNYIWVRSKHVIMFQT